MLSQKEPMLTPEELKAAAVDEWRELLPLHRELAPPAAFPVDALPPILAAAARKTESVIQAPAAISGQSFLAAATLVAQAHFDVIIDGRVSPLSEFFLTVGESGERKSAVDRVVLAPVRAFEKELRDKYEAEQGDYSNRKTAYDEQRRQITIDKREYKTMEQKRKALAELGPPPNAPMEPTLITEEPTYEGLTKALQDGYPSTGVFSDEGGRLIGGHAMNSENQLKTAAGMSGFWDGTPVSRMRSGDGSIKLYGRRVSLHLMAQPEIAQMLLSNRVLQGQGLLARFLPCYPETTAGTRMYQAVDLTNDADIATYNARMLSLLRMEFPLAVGKRNELEPRKLRPSPEAKAVWIRFHNQVESRQAANGDLQQIRAFASKAPEHALRLAAIMSAFNHPDSTQIGKEDMERGIEFCSFYVGENLRLFHAGAVDPNLADAQKLLAWILARGKATISTVEVYTRGPNAIREAAKCRKIFEILSEHGYVKRVFGGTEYDGAIRKEAWAIRPELINQG